MKSETHHQRANVGCRLGHRYGNRLVIDRICCLGGHVLKSENQTNIIIYLYVLVLGKK